jgi:alpha-N-arabinofuranosidase
MKNHTSPLSHCEFSALALGAPFLLKGRKLDSQAAHITLNPDRVIGQIDPKLYGNFLEHLGRCVQGGIFG